MLSLRNLAHAAAIFALAAVGLTLGLWLRDPHPGGLAFVLVFAVAVAVLLWRLYRPGGIAWAPHTSAAPERVGAEAAPSLPPKAEPPPAPAAEPEPQAAATITSASSPGARRLELPKGSRRAPALALGALALAAIAFIAWPESHHATNTAARRGSPPAAARARATPKPTSKPSAQTPRRVKPRPRPTAARRASARSLGSATLQTGSTGADVRLVQKLFKLPVTGKFDAKTAAAVRSFQGKHRLPTTGAVATLTHKALKKAFP